MQKGGMRPRLSSFAGRQGFRDRRLQFSGHFLTVNDLAEVVLDIAGVAGEAMRFLDVGPSSAVEGGPMQLARHESVAAALLAHAQRIAGARSTRALQSASASRIG